MSNEQIHTFWQQTLSELADVPIEAQLEPAPEQSVREFTTFRVSLLSFEGKRIRGWYSIPKDSSRRKFPAVLAVPGYSGNKAIPTHLVMNGYAVLTLFPRAQGESKAEWQLEEGTYLTYHLTDRNRYFYRGAYMDCVRGVDFLLTRNEIHPERIGMWSRSQGGGLTLATTALDKRLKAGVAEEPFLCNYPLAIETVDTHPFRELKDYLARYPDHKEAALETLAYFDPLNLADFIDSPILVSIGLKDEVCPYRTIIPVFEQIRCQKALIIYPDLGHSTCTDFNVHAQNWLRQYLG